MKKAFYICFIIVLFGCDDQNVHPIPHNIIKKDLFTEVLIDVHLLEGHLTNVNVSDPLLRDESLGKYKFIMEKHNISFDNYKKSYSYYAQQDFFREMMDDVLASIKKREIALAEVEDVKQLNFNEFKNILKKNKANFLFGVDSIPHNEQLDSVEAYFKKNIASLEASDTDSITFFYSLQRYKQNKRLFKTMLRNIKSEKK